MKLQLILIQKFLLIVLLIGFQINYCLAFEVTYNVSNYAGQNIRCHGGNSGWINIVPVGGTFPYTYLWSNGSTLQNQLNLTAGTYTVTVTDASGVTASISIDMTQPDFFSLVLDPKEYEGGYNISEQGGSDGQIETNVGGGTTPYNYLWSTSSTESKISELTAGLYSVTVTDQNGCSLTETVTLIEPTLLHIASIVSPQQNGYNVSCHGGDNGEIDLSVAGGAPPYSYQWSNGNFEEDLHGLTAGEYSVLVTDANDVTTIGQIILTEPQELIVTLNRHVYSNNFHTSCFNCSNGIINSTVAGGSMPYTYTWETGQNTATITNLSAGEYYVLVSDANNCQTSADTRLNAPQREDWSLSGNSNTSTSQYIGTSDAKSLSIKTNNQERIKISANGEIDLNGIVSIDSLKLDHPWSFDTLKIARILPIDGDSIVKIGEGSINFLPQRNRIYGTANPSGLQYHGLGLGLGTVGSGLSSAAIGYNSGATNTASIAIGNKVLSSGINSVIIGSGGTQTLTNQIDNSLMVGFESAIPTFFVGPSNGSGNTGKVGIGTTNTSNKLTISHDQSNDGIGLYNASPGISKNSEIKFFKDGVGQLWGLGNDFGYQGNHNFFLFNNINGRPALWVDQDNRFGVDMYNPTHKLDVNGDIYASSIQDNRITCFSNNTKAEIIASNAVQAFGIGVNGSVGYIYTGMSSMVPSMSFLSDGTVGINVIPPINHNVLYKLYVEGGIAAREVLVTTDIPFPDYVFNHDYDLITIHQLKSFIFKNGHLPHFKPAILENNETKFEIGETQLSIVRTIEEQALYIIQLQEQIDKLNILILKNEGVK